jgi:transcription elongation factor Elf1
MFDLGKYDIDFECPSCGFYNHFYLKQARLRYVIICRGCKANIQLDDAMNEVRKSIRKINKAIAAIPDEINITITL